jgi:hypothetical protein
MTGLRNMDKGVANDDHLANEVVFACDMNIV